MLQKIRRYIESRQLLDGAAKHIVALSGGADSVCLLIVLKRMGYDVEAAHCNFHLRGNESDRDESFCKTICQENNIPLHIVHFDTTTYAELHKVSIEMAARELRYSYFENLRRDIGADDICVAHHKNDSVETVLMNIIRGTGLAGLVGIRPVNGKIIRPLLCVDRDEIEAYLKSIDQHYIIDSTNLVNDVTRNKIRLDVIPMLKSINPSFADGVVKMTEWMEDVESITNESVTRMLEDIMAKSEWGYSLSIDKLQKSVSPRYVLFTVLHPLGFTREQIREVSEFLNKQTGKLWNSESHTVVIDRGCILVAKDEDVIVRDIRMPEEGNYVIDDNCRCIIESVERTPNFAVSREPYVATLDADRITFPLTLRRCRQGDRFVPYGMRGSKLVSDYLTDRKRNYFQRRLQMVLCDATDKVVWLIGERTDARVAITDKTIKCLVVRYLK